MLKLNTLIAQLSENDITSILERFQETRGDKYYTLLMLLRNRKYTESEIAEELKLSSGAYYTLKSRLHDRIQEFLALSISGSKNNLVQAVSDIPNLLFNTKREITIAILKKLEVDLIKNDLQHELRAVYAALMKLYLYTPKYYEYSQLYNKHLAYTAAIDKAEELVGLFFKSLGQYLLSRNNEDAKLLDVIKNEIYSISSLYVSHHIHMIRDIIYISVELFLPLSKENSFKHRPIVEDLLENIHKTINSYSAKKTYTYIDKIYYFLAFEYYMDIKVYSQAAKWLKKLDEQLDSFMCYTFCCIPGKFLISRMQFSFQTNQPEILLENNYYKNNTLTVDINDTFNYIQYKKYVAALAISEKKYFNAITELNNTLAEVSWKNYIHAEVELRLMMAYCYIFIDKRDTANNLLKGIARKIKELNSNGDYQNAILFLKFLQYASGVKLKSKHSPEKLRELIDLFTIHNNSSVKMLECLNITQDVILDIVKMYSKSMIRFM